MAHEAGIRTDGVPIRVARVVVVGIARRVTRGKLASAGRSWRKTHLDGGKTKRMLESKKQETNRLGSRIWRKDGFWTLYTYHTRATRIFFDLLVWEICWVAMADASV